jgi:hypothetical protein
MVESTLVQLAVQSWETSMLKLPRMKFCGIMLVLSLGFVDGEGRGISLEGGRRVRGLQEEGHKLCLERK